MHVGRSGDLAHRVADAEREAEVTALELDERHLSQQAVDLVEERVFGVERVHDDELVGSVAEHVVVAETRAQNPRQALERLVRSLAPEFLVHDMEVVDVAYRNVDVFPLVFFEGKRLAQREVVIHARELVARFLWVLHVRLPCKVKRVTWLPVAF